MSQMLMHSASFLAESLAYFYRLYYTVGMRDIKLLSWLGVWLLILPFLGIPGSWKERLVTLTGLCILLAVLSVYYRTTV